jgi:hypothetical protein
MLIKSFKKKNIGVGVVAQVNIRTNLSSNPSISKNNNKKEKALCYTHREKHKTQLLKCYIFIYLRISCTIHFVSSLINITIVKKMLNQKTYRDVLRYFSYCSQLKSTSFREHITYLRLALWSNICIILEMCSVHLKIKAYFYPFVLFHSSWHNRIP